MITIVRTGRARDRPDDDALDPDAERRRRSASVADERRPVRPAVVRDQRPGDVGREHRHLALGEVDHPGRAVDQDERERERGVDRARREPRDDLLEEVGHSSSPGSSCGRIRRGRARRSSRTRRPCRPRARTRARRPRARSRAFCSTTSTVRPSFSFSSRTIRKISRVDERREPERRLVEEQQPRPAHQRAGEREHLLLAAGERAGVLVEPLADPGEVAAHPLDVAVERAAPRVGAEPQVLLAPTARRTCRGPRGRARRRACATASGPRRPSGVPSNGSRRCAGPCPRSRAASSSCRRRSRRAPRRSGPPRPRARPRAAPAPARSAPRRPQLKQRHRAPSRRVGSAARCARRCRGRPRSRPGSRCTSAGVPLGDLAAEVEHVHVVGDAHDEVHVVLDEEHGQLAVVADLPDEAAELLDLLVVEPARRLVEQQQLRLRRRARGRARPASASRTAGRRRAAARRRARPT